MMQLLVKQRRQQTPGLVVDAERKSAENNSAFAEETPLCRDLRYSGLMAWQNGQLDDAVKYLSSAVALAPDHSMLLSELASVLSATGKKTEAGKLIKRALEINPDQPQAWLTLAGLCGETGEKAEAEQAYLSALRAAPSLPQALTGLGLLYLEQRRYHDAARSLSAAVSRGVETFAIHACLGQALFLLGDIDRSHHYFQCALRIQPGDERLLKKLGLTSLMRSLADHSPQQAISDYRAFVACDAEAALAACREAFHYLAGYGYKDQAIQMGQYLLNEDPTDSIICYQLDALQGCAHERAPDTYLTAYFDKFAETFDKQLVDNLNYRVPELCYEELGRLGRQFNRMLDIGCGTGLAAPYLLKLGASLTGVDISSRMLEKAAQRNLYDCLTKAEAVEFLNRSAESFQLIVALDVLVYFGNLRPLFNGVADRLARGGVFAISYEISESQNSTLLTSGRFGHCPEYIREIASENFEILSEVPTMLRLEANRPVDGRIVLLRRR